MIAIFSDIISLPKRKQGGRTLYLVRQAEQIPERVIGIERFTSRATGIAAQDEAVQAVVGHPSSLTETVNLSKALSSYNINIDVLLRPVKNYHGSIKSS